MRKIKSFIIVFLALVAALAFVGCDDSLTIFEPTTNEFSYLARNWTFATDFDNPVSGFYVHLAEFSLQQLEDARLVANVTSGSAILILTQIYLGTVTRQFDLTTFGAGRTLSLDTHFEAYEPISFRIELRDAVQFKMVMEF